MRVLGVDPGPSESAYMLLVDGNPSHFGKFPNQAVLDMLIRNDIRADLCVIEKIASFGMAVGETTFETVYWTGRFAQAFGPGRCYRITRNEVKNHLCHSSRAKDANIRQAILDRFGGKDAAIGKKASKGPLYGVAADAWSALAVGLTWWDNHIKAVEA